VTTGKPTTSAGHRHSSDTPTKEETKPSSATISVALGRKEQIRIAPTIPRASADSCPLRHVQGRRGQSCPFAKRDSSPQREPPRACQCEPASWSRPHASRRVTALGKPLEGRRRGAVPTPPRRRRIAAPSNAGVFVERPQPDADRLWVADVRAEYRQPAIATEPLRTIAVRRLPTSQIFLTGHDPEGAGNRVRLRRCATVRVHRSSSALGLRGPRSRGRRSQPACDRSSVVHVGHARLRRLVAEP
jgi:hypothetical protein